MALFSSAVVASTSSRNNARGNGLASAHRTPRRQGTNRLSKAFTLLEILVVLAILGLLVGLAITNVDKIWGGAQADTTRMFVNQTMSLPLTTYRIRVGDFPSTGEGLQALMTAPSGKADRWTGPYVEKIPLDPWGEPYQYAYPGTRNKGSYDLWSKGPDKQSGTEDDIGNWAIAAPENK
jgi:general secretion pathway protein G